MRLLGLTAVMFIATLVVHPLAGPAHAADCRMTADSYAELSVKIFRTPCEARLADGCIDHDEYPTTIGFMLGSWLSDTVPRSRDAEACLKKVSVEIEQLFRGIDQVRYNHGLGIASIGGDVSDLPVDMLLPDGWDPTSTVVIIERMVAAGIAGAPTDTDARSDDVASTNDVSERLVGRWRMTLATAPNGETRVPPVASYYIFQADGVTRMFVEGDDTTGGTWRLGPRENELTLEIAGQPVTVGFELTGRDTLKLFDTNDSILDFVRD